MKMRYYLFMLLIFTGIMTACKFIDQVQNTSRNTVDQQTPINGPISSLSPAAPETQVSTFKGGVTGTPEPKQTPTEKTPVPPPADGKKPPQSQAADIRPPERRAELTRLSNLLSFQVTDQKGVVLGKVSNFIINTCETYIIYFLIDPAADLKVAAGSRLVIPFEAVTINSGALDAQSKSIVLALAPNQLSSAPAFPDPLQLLPNNWEAAVRAYWLKIVRVSHLTSECKVSGGAVATHKIAYATQLLGAELKDGNHNLLGTVVEAILEPESGKLGFFVVDLKDKQGLVLVSLGAVNIPKEALEPGIKIELVLLTDNLLLQNAPRINAIEEATNVQSQSVARQYWGH